MLSTVLADGVAWWSSAFSNHQSVSVLVRFSHLAAILLGGGAALAADRRILQAAKGDTEGRKAALAELDRAHPHVMRWVVTLAIIGVLLTASDTATFLVSKLFWIKMAVVALLTANGGTMLLVERRVRRVGLDAGWNRLAAVSAISAILWLTTLFLGTLLTVAA